MKLTRRELRNLIIESMHNIIKFPQKQKDQPPEQDEDYISPEQEQEFFDDWFDSSLEEEDDDLDNLVPLAQDEDDLTDEDIYGEYGFNDLFRHFTGKDVDLFPPKPDSDAPEGTPDSTKNVIDLFSKK